MTNWFYTDDFGLVQGPISDAQLKKLAVEQIIRPDTPLETDAGKKGKAGQIRGLFPAAPAPINTEPPPLFSDTEIAAMQTERVSPYPSQQIRAFRKSQSTSQIFDWIKHHKKGSFTIAFLLITLVSWLFSLVFNESFEGKWVLAGESNIGAPTTVEFRKDGTGFINGGPITWGTERERVGRRSYRNNLLLRNPAGENTMCGYSIFGSTLTLIFADGKAKYKKQQNDTPTDEMVVKAEDNAIAKGDALPAAAPVPNEAVVGQKSVPSDVATEIRKVFAQYKTAIQNKNGKAAAECISEDALRYYAFLLRGAKEFEKGYLQSNIRVSVLDRYLILETRHRMPKETLLAMKEGKELFIYSIENGFLGSDLITEYDRMGKISKRMMYNKERDDLMNAVIFSKNKPVMIVFALSPAGQWKLDTVPPLGSVITQALLDRSQNKGPVARAGRVGIALEFPDESILLDLEQRTGKKPDDSIWVPPVPRPSVNLPQLEAERRRQEQQQREQEGRESYERNRPMMEQRQQEEMQRRLQDQEFQRRSKLSWEEKQQEDKERHQKFMEEVEQQRKAFEQRVQQDIQQRKQRQNQMPPVPPARP